ncbi:MAG: hypothetical protein IJM62_02430 [Lachnospiraceae bacterium]|nr:hypothetical protein [Lachnospiraceae bacterium]
MKKFGIIILAMALMAASFALGFMAGRKSAETDDAGEKESSVQTSDAGDDKDTSDTGDTKEPVTEDTDTETSETDTTDTETGGQDASRDPVGETVITVGSREVGIDEISYYMYLARDKYVMEYGEDPWSIITDDGESVADYAKRTMLSEVTDIQILCAEASGNGVKLDESEEKAAVKAADEYMDSLGDMAEGFGLSREAVEKIYIDEALSRKVYGKITDDISEDIEKDEELKDKSEEEKSDLIAEKFDEMMESLRKKYPVKTTELWESLVMGSVG